jgi:hypothetical protein
VSVLFCIPANPGIGPWVLSSVRKSIKSYYYNNTSPKIAEIVKKGWRGDGECEITQVAPSAPLRRMMQIRHTVGMLPSIHSQSVRRWARVHCRYENRHTSGGISGLEHRWSYVSV